MRTAEAAGAPPPTALVRKIEAASGENVAACMQCGTCSASCPLAADMEVTPRRAIEMIRAGLEDELVQIDTYWYCASCYSCAVRCPRGINVAEVMYALKRLALGRVSNSSTAFYRAFSRVVKGYGRLWETELMVRFGLGSNPFRLLGYAPLGLKMLSRGKMPLQPHRMRGVQEVRTLLRKAAELEGEG